MFERFTEKARRAIFFARYEASQFGRPYIEAEHLLLGVFREDRALVSQFLASYSRLEVIRQAITERGKSGVSISTSLDLPLSRESQHVLEYAAEEAESMNHQHVGTPHLLLGLLREENSFAAQLLVEQGLVLDSVREQVQQSEPLAPGRPASVAGLDRWLSEHKAPTGVWAVKQKRLANGTTHFAFYRNEPESEIAQIRQRIDSLIDAMERAIASHEFEKARAYADEEKKAREQLNLEELPPRLPLLCIEIIRDDRFSEVQKRCDGYIAQGVPQIWLLDAGIKRAYTVTATEGLREFKGAVLEISSPPLKMDLSRIFD